MAHHLSEKEIFQLYDLLYLYESKIKDDPKGYNWKTKEINQFKKENHIVFDMKSEVISYSKDNTILFSSNKSHCISFIRHIRNAFAHGLISKESNNILLIQDRYRGKLTMYGRIESRLLFQFIELIKKQKQKNE